MKIAITGGTGFVGSHLASHLASRGAEIVVVARNDRAPRARSAAIRMVPAEIDDVAALEAAFTGCAAVAHCAGINREIGSRTFDRVHVVGTRAVIEAARRCGVRKIVLLSFLRARPHCGSRYHETKWAAEELVRSSGLDYTILKAGMIYGLGDHMLDHLSHALLTLPLFATVGIVEKPIRPLAVADLVAILDAALTSGRMSCATIAVTGPEELHLSEAVRRVGGVLGRNPLIVPAPVVAQRALSVVFEATMRVPLVARAQVQMLAEGMTEALPFADDVASDLAPSLRFTPEQIAAGLPARRAFGLRDLRCCLTNRTAETAAG
jgi:NADH dehydrogenase